MTTDIGAMLTWLASRYDVVEAASGLYVAWRDQGGDGALYPWQCRVAGPKGKQTFWGTTPEDVLLKAVRWTKEQQKGVAGGD